MHSGREFSGIAGCGHPREGLDLRILRDLDFARFRPWFVQVEPSDDYAAGNSEDIRRLMRSLGYRLVAKTNVNLMFAA